MRQLAVHDVNWLVNIMPKDLAYQLKEFAEKGQKYIIAGGFLRSAIAKEKINDIDVFATSKGAAEDLVAKLQPIKTKQFVTENAVSFTMSGKSVQVIYKWTFESAESIIEHFDFTIAQACIWYDKDTKEWTTLASDDFYQDLAGKRLIYTNPANPEAGGSLLRMLKFKKRGYEPTGYTISKIIANLTGASEDTIFNKLKEIDPRIQPSFTDVNKYSDKTVIKQEAEKLAEEATLGIESKLKTY